MIRVDQRYAAVHRRISTAAVAEEILAGNIDISLKECEFGQLSSGATALNYLTDVIHSLFYLSPPLD